MDDYDFIEKKPKRRFRIGSALMNMVSLGLILATLCVGGYYALIYLNPESEFNPLPPSAVGSAPPASPTALEPQIAEATTEESTATATSTADPPTATTVPATATVTPTREPGSYYELQPGSPVALDSSIFHPDDGCKFLGVAGQAFGLEDTPIPGLNVWVSGLLNGEVVDKLGLTGAASQYGAGSYYEIILADEPIASEDSLNIQLLDADGVPASDAYAFNTFASCEQNLILINFKALP